MFNSDLAKNYPTAVKFLTNAITKNRLANSYVFVGNDINDIQNLVVNLAKILNCEKNTFLKPCEGCTSCKWLERNEHPHALINITFEEKTKKVAEGEPRQRREQIKIESIRELLSNLTISSTYFRVVFFKNSDLYSLPPECGNLLLKTVEESPERIIFIFANNTKNDVLSTILSRSQTVYLSKKVDSINDLLNNKNIEIETIDLETTGSDLSWRFQNAKKINEYLNQNEVNLKDSLVNASLNNYKKLRDKSLKKFYTLYENLLNAFQKSKAFMQQRIVLEDLFLNI